MPNTFLLKRGVEETLETGLVTTNSGSNVAVLPTELMGARMSVQTIFSVAPNVGVSVPLLGSCDGVNFSPLTYPTSNAGTTQPVILTQLGGETLVFLAEGVKAIKVGTVAFTGGGTVTIKLRAC